MLTTHSSFPDSQQARENMEQKYTKKWEIWTRKEHGQV